jgi:cell wall-associated NlpC family hydrolase
VEVPIPDRTPLTPRRTALVLLALAALLIAGCGRGPVQSEQGPAVGAAEAAGGEAVLTPESARAGREQLEREDGGAGAEDTDAQVVQLTGAGAEPEGAVDPSDDAPSPGAPSDAEVRAELREARAALANFRQHLSSTASLRTGRRARVLPDGTAIAPAGAPDVVKRVILAGNEIAKFPYKWGGGHGAWRDDGYDCSGSVSFALAGAGLLRSPMTSGLFMNYGAPGPGRWITIYANAGHMFMVVAGLRFDTSGQGRAGTRWQEGSVSTAGFAVRHVPGL